MAGTPVSRILETIQIVVSLQEQVAALTASFDKLSLRVDAAERALSREQRAGGKPGG